MQLAQQVNRLQFLNKFILACEQGLWSVKERRKQGENDHPLPQCTLGSLRSLIHYFCAFSPLRPAESVHRLIYPVERDEST